MKNLDDKTEKYQKPKVPFDQNKYIFDDKTSWEKITIEKRQKGKEKGQRAPIPSG